MKQIFLLGASGFYGVGGTNGGLGNLVKAYVHSKMYANGGTGEKFEVFDFSKSGVGVEFVTDNTPWIFDKYSRGHDTLALVSVGGNDAKAKGNPDGYVCMPEDFELKIGQMFDALQAISGEVVYVSNHYVDESKTNPKLSPFNPNNWSYFTNQRRFLFNDIVKRVCDEKQIGFLSLNASKTGWINHGLYADGLHPNQDGYEQFFDLVRPTIDDFLAD